MKNIFFFIFLSPFLYSQNYQVKDSLKVLAMSNFKSMVVFENKNGKLIPKRNYSYDQSKNQIIIKNISEKEKQWLMTIIKLDKNYHIQEEERVFEVMLTPEKENISVNKQVSMIRKYFYNSNNTVDIKDYNSNGVFWGKEFIILDQNNNINESIKLFTIADDIVVTEIERYNWIDNKNYHYEKLTFNAPKSRVVGDYTLNQYGERSFFKGSMTLNDETEEINIPFGNKLKKFDAKGNIIQLYTLFNGKENVVEERKIVY
ncbi:hypothetical protein LF887_10880 [Chryseobacterium sp. MEBOG06]|uniref:hypothetical protein n=1 Tax=Chryseobacterium sp. MEBOG06 TaxID=2879938 RepID=UPI001F30A20F|nr:hypothetical protein [Chryseobacterium sp. MEBOG06]UKB86100.1 hypothetical protein LF887_10880 [Chryseobacterium sp. MEBOG06]